MRQLAVTALGRDRPGIVAAITAVLVAHRLNVADSRMGIVSGRFSVVLIVQAIDEPDPDTLRADLERVGRELGLDVVLVHEVDEATAPPPVATHVVTVYGADHPGIVHAVASELAGRGVDITDMTTRLAGSSDTPLYAMVLEIAVAGDAGDLRAALERVAAAQGVDISVHERDAEAL